MDNVVVSVLCETTDVDSLYTNAGKSFKNALTVLEKHDYINFKNYEYFYQLTYRYNYDVKQLLNKTYMDFVYYVADKEDCSIDHDCVILNNAAKYVKEFIYKCDFELTLKRRAAMIGILDLLSDSAKPGKFVI